MRIVLKFALLFGFGLLAGAASAQSYGRYQTCQLQTAQGQAVAGAQVYFLTQPANTSNLTPQAQVYSSATGGTVSQPILTDGFGNCSAYLTPGVYTVCYASPYTGQLCYLDQNISIGGGTPSSPAFGSITSGTNTAAAMLVGTGASLGPTGTGTVSANAIGLVVVTGTAQPGYSVVATSPTAAAWQAGATSGVSSFNTRTGAVTLLSADVSSALSGLTNCTTAGYVYSPGSGGCLSLPGATSCPATTFSATPTFTYNSSAPCTSITMIGNVTSSSASGNVAGTLYELVIVQDGTGGRTFVPPTQFKGGPTMINRAANGKTVCNYLAFTDNNLYLQGSCQWF